MGSSVGNYSMACHSGTRKVVFAGGQTVMDHDDGFGDTFVFFCFMLLQNWRNLVTSTLKGRKTLSLMVFSIGLVIFIFTLFTLN